MVMGISGCVKLNRAVLAEQIVALEVSDLCAATYRNNLIYHLRYTHTPRGQVAHTYHNFQKPYY
jgi:hypothetical protein